MVALSLLFSCFLGVLVGSGYILHCLWFFIALGVVESILEDHVISMPINVMTKLLGALLFHVVMNGGRVSTMFSYAGSRITAELNVLPRSTL